MPGCVRHLVLILLLGLPSAALAQAPVNYQFSFAEREHHLMRVEAVFSGVPAGPLQLRMSRSSPGRYALHEFAKNLFDLRVTTPAGMPLTVAHPAPQQWDVTGHTGTVRVSYTVFGDRTDGTYLSVDTSHAHINMPSAVMWARGFELRPIAVRFLLPAGANWRVGTQLLPSADPATFSAPNLQYLMDSPTEVSAFTLRTFTVAAIPQSPTFRIVLHHGGTDADADVFAKDVERIVGESRNVFGEYPAYEGNTYSFIADYLPWASGDGMEHRNSTILTSVSSIRANRRGLLDTVAHEFFHSWNVERIRPRTLEPFNLDDVNMSGELWLAEGFTNYYGPLVLARTGLTTAGDFAQEIGPAVDEVLVSPARRIRSAEEMSQFAPFVDAASAIDRTSFDNTFISYYTWGEAIALGLDLSLRDRTGGTVTLDHYMRALWQTFGKPGGRVPGYVDKPYTIADLESTLATVSGDARFAADFFARYIRGHDVVDYATLLDRAGFTMRRRAPGEGFAGDFRIQDVQGRARITSSVPFDSPAYSAGLDRDDFVISVGGTPVRTASEVDRAIRTAKPGQTLPVVFERRGQPVMSSLRIVEDPHVEIVLSENAGKTLTEEQKRFRQGWLSSPVRNTF